MVFLEGLVKDFVIDGGRLKEFQDINLCGGLPRMVKEVILGSGGGWGFSLDGYTPSLGGNDTFEGMDFDFDGGNMSRVKINTAHYIIIGQWNIVVVDVVGLVIRIGVG